MNTKSSIHRISEIRKRKKAKEESKLSAQETRSANNESDNSKISKISIIKKKKKYVSPKDNIIIQSQASANMDRFNEIRKWKKARGPKLTAEEIIAQIEKESKECLIAQEDAQRIIQERINTQQIIKEKAINSIKDKIIADNKIIAEEYSKSIKLSIIIAEEEINCISTQEDTTAQQIMTEKAEEKQIVIEECVATENEKEKKLIEEVNEILLPDITNNKEQMIYLGNRLFKLIHPSMYNTIIEKNKYDIDITYGKLICLNPGKWLNDEVINYYMQMLSDENKRLNKNDPKSLYLNSFFLTKLLEKRNGEMTYTYENVKRWTKNHNIFEMDKIYIPLNINNNHWVLIIVKMEMKEIYFYDSLYRQNRSYFYCNNVLRWIEDEYKKLNVNKDVTEIQDLTQLDGTAEVFDRNDWMFNDGYNICPQQTNSFDCGVFTICCADYSTFNHTMCHTQEEMPYWRNKIACRILAGSFTFQL